MKRGLRQVSAQSVRQRRERVYALILHSRRIYPENRSLRHKWIRARLALGKRQPKVNVGLEQCAVFPRTAAEASKRSEFSALAPRTMREAGISEGHGSTLVEYLRRF